MSSPVSTWPVSDPGADSLLSSWTSSCLSATDQWPIHEYGIEADDVGPDLSPYRIRYLECWRSHKTISSLLQTLDMDISQPVLGEDGDTILQFIYCGRQLRGMLAVKRTSSVSF